MHELTKKYTISLVNKHRVPLPGDIDESYYLQFDIDNDNPAANGQNISYQYYPNSGLTTATISPPLL